MNPQGRILQDSAKVEIRGPQMIIKDIRSDMAGDYTCEKVFSNGVSRSNELHLHVVGKSIINSMIYHRHR